MNLKNKNNTNDLEQKNEKKEIENNIGIDNFSIEEQIDLFADLIVEQLLIELNEKIKD
jgi:hypothetical protein